MMVPAKDIPHPAADAARWVVKRYLELKIEISTHGRFGTIEDGKLFIIKDNHLKSMLRKDYLEAHGHLTGINRIIQDILDNAKKMSAQFEGEGRVFAEAYKLPT